MQFLSTFFANLFAAGAKSIIALVLSLIVIGCLSWAALHNLPAIVIAVIAFVLRWAIVRKPDDPSPLPGDDR